MDVVSGRASPGSGQYDFEEVIQSITTGIDPLSWEEVGGNGSICEFTGNGIAALVISQPWQTHEKIERLLAQLRRTRHRGLPRPAAKPPTSGGIGLRGF